MQHARLIVRHRPRGRRGLELGDRVGGNLRRIDSQVSRLLNTGAGGRHRRRRQGIGRGRACHRRHWRRLQRCHRRCGKRADRRRNRRGQRRVEGWIVERPGWLRLGARGRPLPAASCNGLRRRGVPGKTARSAPTHRGRHRTAALLLLRRVGARVPGEPRTHLRPRGRIELSRGARPKAQDSDGRRLAVAVDVAVPHLHRGSRCRPRSALGSRWREQGLATGLEGWGVVVGV